MKPPAFLTSTAFPAATTATAAFAAPPHIGRAQMFASDSGFYQFLTASSDTLSATIRGAASSLSWTKAAMVQG